MAWTVAAQSKQELIPMHQKLNYLASVCAPDYSPEGYMGGTIFITILHSKTFTLSKIHLVLQDITSEFFQLNQLS